ncbi:DUF1631 family protein [Thiolapillus sp.]
MLESGFNTFSEPGNEISAIPIDWGPHRDIVEGCQKILVDALPGFCEMLFKQIDQDLYRLIKASTSEARRTLLFESMWSFQERHREIERKYIHIAPLWYFVEYHVDLKDIQLPEDDEYDDEETTFAWSSDKDRLEDEARLSLLDDRQLEENVALNTTITQANQGFAREIYALEQRFAHLQNKPVKTAATMPISPILLANSLRDILNEWDDEVIARISIYQSLGHVFATFLKTLYRDTNRYLISRGVLPSLKTNHIRNTAYQPQPRGDEPFPPPSPPASGEQNISGRGLSEAWYQLQPGPPVIQPGFNPNLPVLPHYEVFQTLNQLQMSALSDIDTEQIDWAAVQENLRKQVNQTLCLDEDGKPAKQLDRNDQQIIEIIFRIFDHILDDEAIPNAVRALLGRLQIPVLKTAIQDPSFVDNEEHPARRLLDSIASTSIGWRDTGEASERSLLNHIREIVERIVREYDKDIGLFEEALAEFNEYVRTREKTRKAMEQRITQAISGKEQLAIAQKKISDMLDSPAFAVAPKAIRDVIHGPWANFLTLLYLREGEEGKSWKNALQVTRVVEKYCDPDLEDAERRTLRSRLPAIMKAFQSGLEYVSINKSKSHELLGRLLDAFDEISQAGLKQKQQEIPPRETPVESEDAGDGADQDLFSEMARNLEEDSWIRIILKDGAQPLVCKLVWHSQFTHTMVFVDGNGNKALQLKDAELASHLRAGRATILEDTSKPLIERILGRMKDVFSSSSEPN